MNQVKTNINAVLDTPLEETIDTRFGKIKVRKDNPVVFPRGLLGMPDKFNFSLVDFPNEKFARFKLLQSLDSYELAFITLPVDLKNDIITAADLSEAAKEVGFAEQDMSVLLIVSVERKPDQIVVTVNARAPVLVDTVTRTAIQHVFRNDTYSVQHIITL